MTSDLLLELGCEDLPARYVVPLAKALADGIANGLNKRGVSTGEARRYDTPRRIAVLIAGVTTQQPEQKIDLTGPAVSAALKDGQPTPAALGFARKCGVEFAALGEKDGKLHYAKTEAGRKTLELIPEIFEETLKQMDELVPKRMRWGSGNETFVRPVQWICALLGSDMIPLERFGLKAGRITYGHRFHSPAAIELKSPTEYADKLKAAHVWADVATRRAEIERQIKVEATKLGGAARINPDLLDEVTALVEWPVVISGNMEQRFMRLPPEVIVSTVETNQRYFTVFENEHFTDLKPNFITISNIESRDAAQVIAGNERVVRPRLSDALFFWEQDLKTPFESYKAKLTTITYRKELGTIADKVSRIDVIASQIAQKLNIDAGPVRKAASLCKNDLATKMVYEFPELQGRMGGHYAKHDGQSEKIADAIRDHYLPLGQTSVLPSNDIGCVISLADKLDTLAGIFAIGQKPTASKDPFALRRAAFGIVRICIERGADLDFRDLLTLAINTQPLAQKGAGVLHDLIEFIFERLRSYYEIKGIPNEMFEAVKALGITRLDDFDHRINALQAFWTLPSAKNLAAAHKRVRNILKQAGDAGSGEINAKLLTHEAEKSLHAKMTELVRLNAKADYATRLANLATLREAVDGFFEGVMVNDKEEAIRNNRLALLRQLDTLCRDVADISLLPG